MTESGVESISQVTNVLLRQHGLEVAPVSDLVVFVRGVLHGPDELLGCFHDGLVTAEEVASVILDRSYLWATHRAGKSVSGVDVALSAEAVRLLAEEIAALER